MDDLFTRYPSLVTCKDSIEDAIKTIISCYDAGGKVLLCGNGGSAADCDHIVGELMKGFLKKRPIPADRRESMRTRYTDIDENMLSKLQMGLPAISLPSVTALNSAVSNDIDGELVYAQGLLAMADERDVLIAISTSGNAANVFHAVSVAKALGVGVIGLTGKTGGRLAHLSDVCICVPEFETYKVQELHLPVYHYICAVVEEHFFP